jgi:ATP-dependent DNA helicase RecQ
MDYFGERYPGESCGMCDNCLAGKRETQDLSLAAQKLLSCVKRTGESFGVEHVIDVLRGSKAQKVVRRRHDKLSTYGIGLEYSKNQWRHLARQLLHKGFLTQDMEYGGLQLTPRAWELFRGQCTFHGVLPTEGSVREEANPKPSEEAKSVKHDRLLFELLRKKRKQLADEAQVPPFVIFSDKTLMEMAAWFPQSKESLLQINGVGQIKEQRYGADFLDIIRRYCAENGIAEGRRPESPLPKTSSGTASGQKKRYVEIGEAYNSGRSIPELMAQYDVKRVTVVGHLYSYWQDGHSLRCDEDLPAAIELTAETQTEALDAFDRLGYQALRPVYEALNQAVRYDDLHILRLYYIAARLPQQTPQKTDLL